MWNSTDIIAATKGTLTGAPFTCQHVTIDSRKSSNGALFIALKGERMDGHDYVKDAFAQGAVAAIVSHIPEGLPKHDCLILVPDTYKALVDLAIAARSRTQSTIIAVTGSVGKTGTKDAIRTALLEQGDVYGTQGNLNNHIGLPLSLTNMPENARYSVFELGMNHAGEIAFLARLTRPHIAIITTIEAVHLEFFKDVSAIADAKAEILEGMDKNGIVILNRDNRFYDRLHAHATKHGITRIIGFGTHENAECHLTGYALEGLHSRVEAVIHGVPLTYQLGTAGKHWAITSLAVLAATTAAGVDLADAAASLAHFHEPEGRGKLHRIHLPQGDITLIDDCYNASPASMQAGLAKLNELHQAITGGGRKIAVLGDMLELGAAGIELHKGLAESLIQYGIDKVYVAGPLMKHLYETLPEKMQGAYAANASLLAPSVNEQLLAEDIVLIKGSRGSRMDKVRDFLIAKASEQPAGELTHAV